MDDYSRRIDELTKAVGRANRNNVLAHTGREIRDSMRHREAMGAQASLQASQEMLHESLVRGLESIYSASQEQIRELRRIAEAAENPLAIRAAELRKQGATHIQAGAWGRAREALERSLEEDATAFPTYLGLAIVFLHTDRTDHLVATLESALGYVPREVDVARGGSRPSPRNGRAFVLQLLATAHAKAGRMEQAVRLAREAYRIEPHIEHRARIAHDLLYYLVVLGDHEEAVELFRAAILILPNHAVRALRAPRLAPIADQLQALVDERMARLASAALEARNDYRRRLDPHADAAEAVRAERERFEAGMSDLAAPPGPAEGEGAYWEASEALAEMEATLARGVSDRDYPLIARWTDWSRPVRETLSVLEGADLDAERAHWRSETRTRSRRRATKVLSRTGLAALFAVALIGTAALAAFVYLNQEGPPAPVDYEVATTEHELGRNLGGIVVNLGMDPGNPGPPPGVQVGQSIALNEAAAMHDLSPSLTFGLYAETGYRARQFPHLAEIHARAREHTGSSVDDYAATAYQFDRPLSDETFGAVDQYLAALEPWGENLELAPEGRAYIDQLRSAIADEVERTRAGPDANR